MSPVFIKSRGFLSTYVAGYRTDIGFLKAATKDNVIQMKD